MKTQHMFRILILFIAVSGLLLTGCQKDKNTEPNVDSTSLQQLSTDEEALESANDESMNDVNGFLSGGNEKSTAMLPCNATLDSTAVVNDTITYYITYNGLNCSGTRFRTGQVEIKKRVGTHWFMTGATVMVRHINFTITRVSTQKSITLNSVKIHQNVTGGGMGQLGNGLDAIIHKTWGRVHVTFDDSTTKLWNVSRKKTYTGSVPFNLKITTDGFGVAGGFDDLVVWGINRQGENFFTQILEPVVQRQVCDWDPVSGIKKHIIPADSKSAVLTFGFNSNNQPISGNECPTKFRVDWQKNNNSGTIYLWL
jgi:hypothetical protein